MNLYKQILEHLQSTPNAHLFVDNLLEYREGYSPMSPNDKWADQVVTGAGDSYGAELLLQKNTGKTTGWLAYTWSKSIRLFNRPGEEIFSGKKYYAGNDRRHNLNLVINHRFNEHWEASLAWNYQTGRRGTLSTTTFLGNGPSEFNTDDHAYLEYIKKASETKF